jgi:UDP-galactose transporter B1
MIRFVVCASGICFSYWFYGYLQEKLITKSRLGATFMLVIQTITNIFVALAWQYIEKISTTTTTTTNKTSTTTPKSLNHPLILLTSTCYVFAMAASNESLRYVSYPVAVLGKSCKIIPTMVMGFLIEQRHYSLQQWLSAVCISAGIALFHFSRINPNTTNDEKQQEQSATSTTEHYWKGMALLCISLCMDGFLGACQGILKRPDIQHDKQRPPTAVETMLYVNLYSLLFLFPMAYFSGQWTDGVQLLLRNEQLQISLSLLNSVVSIGQIFIFLTITWYSSLVTTTITTTRKFFTILFSVIHFGHDFTVGQWTSVIMVFTGLYLSIADTASSPSSSSSGRTFTTKNVTEGKKID